MALAGFNLHPLLLFAFQILGTTLVIGFSRSQSLLRPATLPLIAFCAYGTICTSPAWMRLHWASLLSGSSVGFVLQYIELALLSKWSFETRKYAVLHPDLRPNLASGPTRAPILSGSSPANGKAVENGHSLGDGVGKMNGHAKNDNSKRTKIQSNGVATEPDMSRKTLEAGNEAHATTAIDRLYFGLVSTFSFRSVNTIYEVKNVPPFRNNKVPTTIWFLSQQAFVVLVCILVVDVSSAPPPPPNRAELFAPEHTKFFSRITEVTSDELILRVMSTIIYWANMYAIMQGCVSASAIVLVGSGLSPVSSWRPFFGKPKDAYDLRAFWGKFWHQMLRQVLSNPASFIINQVLHIRKGTFLSRYGNLALSFIVSGVLHSLAEVAGGLPLKQSGTLSFFCIQVLGIMCEDTVKGMFKNRTRNESRRSLYLDRTAGYAWVALFLIWSTPGWLYPDAAGPPKAPFLPFSLIKTSK